MASCILLKFYIKPQLSPSWSFFPVCCILLKFYIKPQPVGQALIVAFTLYLIEILHQTTTSTLFSDLGECCILLKFYIKPQPVLYKYHPLYVVSYWNSTSNHNLFRSAFRFALGCILLKFYIKPQPSRGCRPTACVVSYWNSTSNHNMASLFLVLACCILLKFYIKPQPITEVLTWRRSCILLKFYIKPQLALSPYPGTTRVVSYWNSTSNHNWWGWHAGRFVVVSYWNSTSNHNSPCEAPW